MSGIRGSYDYYYISIYYPAKDKNITDRTLYYCSWKLLSQFIKDNFITIESAMFCNFLKIVDRLLKVLDLSPHNHNLYESFKHYLSMLYCFWKWTNTIHDTQTLLKLIERETPAKMFVCCLFHNPPKAAKRISSRAICFHPYPRPCEKETVLMSLGIFQLTHN